MSPKQKKMQLSRSSLRWWDVDPQELHHKLIGAFKQIESAERTRRTRNANYLGKYEQRELNSLDGTEWAVVKQVPLGDNRENVIRSVIDAAVAKISTNRPRLVFVSIGGDFTLQRRAEKLTSAVEGILKTGKAYQLGRNVFRDGLVFDCGHVKVYPDVKNNRVGLDRVLDDDVIVDALDGKYGKPKSLMQIQTMSRDVLRAMFPKKTFEVENANLIRQTVSGVYAAIDEPVHVIEAWHLPTHEDAGDGLHVISSSAGILEQSEWKQPFFPIVTWRWKTRCIGWRGMGIIEDLGRLQDGLDWIDMKIKKILNIATVRAFAQRNSKINVEELTGEEFSIAYYDGTPPAITPDPSPPEALLMEREKIKASMYEQSGISQLLASSKKPAGLSSGEALREYKDTESERFQDVGQNWEDFWTEIAERCCWAAGEMGSGYMVQASAQDGRGMLNTKWSDVRMDRNEYQIQILPASTLPRDMAGRKDIIADMIQMFPGAAPLFAKLMANADTDAAISIVSAAVDAILMDIEKLDAGEVVTPEPFIDLQSAKTLVLASYLKARNNNAPEEVLAGYRQYLLQVDAVLKQTAMAAAGTGTAMGSQMLMGTGIPQGQPGAMPGGPGMPPGIPPQTPLMG